MKTVTSIRLPDTLKAQLQALADADNRTLNNYIETVLLKHVESKKLMYDADFEYNPGSLVKSLDALDAGDDTGTWEGARKDAARWLANWQSNRPEQTGETSQANGS